MALLAALAACHPGAQTPGEERRAASRSQAQAAYRPPPAVTAVVRQSDGRLRLEGLADPSAQVRLAAPAGPVALAKADGAGRWRATLPAAASVRLLGLSMTAAGRSIQSEGYLALAPDGLAAQLRAGAGAFVIGPQRRPLALSALDFDRRGAAVVSARGRPGQDVVVVVDGVSVAKTAPGPDGRLSIDLPAPLTPGPHALAVVQGAQRSEAHIELPPLAAPVGSPFDGRAVAGGYAIDWVTPAGGLQGALLIEPEARA